MSTHDAETAAQRLRETAQAAGIPPELDPHDWGIQLESADDLLSRLLATDEPRPITSAPRRRARRVALALGAAAAAAAIAAVAAVAVVQPWSKPAAVADAPPGLSYQFASAQRIADAPGRDAAGGLRDLAVTARHAPASTTTGRYQYVVTSSYNSDIDANGTSALVPQLTETWLSDAGTIRTVVRKERPLSQDGRGVARPGTWDTLRKTADETITADSSFAPALADSLPTSAAPLRRALIRRAGCEDDTASADRAACLVDQVVDISSFYVVRPELRSAMWTMLADEPAVRLLGSVKDRAGRTGVGVAVVAARRPAYRHVLIISPADGSLLGQENVLIRRVPGIDAAPPAILDFTTFQASGRSDTSGTLAR